MQRFVRTFWGITAIGLFSVAGCAAVVPHELADARSAYQHASASRAADLSPAELHKAKEALTKAEESWSNDPKSAQTRDLSYVAQRKAQLAEATAGMALANNNKAAADQSINSSEHAIAKRTEGELSQTREQLAESQRKAALDQQSLGSERDARIAADARAKAAQDALAKLAAVKEEDRGMVITLSGSVLFPSDQSTLLPDAETRLNQVADALMATKERNIVVEGHTDSRGSEKHNLDLSQRRADSVRSYLVARGYEADRMQARGIGKGRPTTSNDTAEGRANNRRVEIIVQPVTK
jgi:outer membrane protein OmpA-like peptidoglycan-associated protein